MLMMIKEGGWGALVAAGVGALGILLGIVALALLPLSRKAGHAMGVITLLCAFAAPAFGLVGMSMGRRLVDGAVSAVDGRGMKARLVHEGYKEAQSAAKVGFYAGLVPLLLGAITSMLGSRKKEDETSSTLRWGFAGAATAIAFLTSGGALAASMGSLPPDMDRASADLVDARDRIDRDLEQGCYDLEDALVRDFWKPASPNEWPRFFNPDPRKYVSDFDAVATRCVRDRFDKIKAGTISSVPGRTVPTYESLLESPLLVDDALEKEIEASKGSPELKLVGGIGDSDAGIGLLGLLGTPPDAGTLGFGHSGSDWPTGTTRLPGRTPPTTNVTAGTTTVGGRLPPEVIQRIMRQNMSQFRYCYEQGLKKDPTLSGKVTVRFVIDSDGNVSSASDSGSTLPDQDVIKCIVRRVSSISFPKPEGGIVTVTYPLTFASAP